jgi:hypothetical protein
MQSVRFSIRQPYLRDWPAFMRELALLGDVILPEIEEVESHSGFIVEVSVRPAKKRET